VIGELDGQDVGQDRLMTMLASVSAPEEDRDD